MTTVCYIPHPIHFQILQPLSSKYPNLSHFSYWHLPGLSHHCHWDHWCHLLNHQFGSCSHVFSVQLLEGPFSILSQIVSLLCPEFQGPVKTTSFLQPTKPHPTAAPAPTSLPSHFFSLFCSSVALLFLEYTKLALPLNLCLAPSLTSFRSLLSVTSSGPPLDH